MSTENTPKSLEEKIAELDAKFEQAEPVEEKEVVEEKVEEVVEEEKIEEEQKPEEKKEEVYVPNLAYKVYDEEKQFDGKVAQLIKSKEDEEFFRDLYTRAEGLPVVKQKLDKYREEAQSYKSKLEEYSAKNNAHEKAWEYYNNMIHSSQGGKLESVNQLLDTLGVSDKILGEVVLQRLNMSPEQKKAIDSERQAKQYESQLKAKEESFSSKEAELMREVAEIRLGNALTAEKDIVEIATVVDSKLGKDAFLNEVKQVGIALDNAAAREARNGGNPSYPSYRQVFDIVANKYKAFLGETSSAQVIPAQNTPAPVIQKKVVVRNNNTLPNLGAGNSETPSNRAIKSLKDLEKERDEHFGNRR